VVTRFVYYYSSSTSCEKLRAHAQSGFAIRAKNTLSLFLWTIFILSYPWLDFFLFTLLTISNTTTYFVWRYVPCSLLN